MRLAVSTKLTSQSRASGMDDTDRMVDGVHVEGDADTLSELCPLCAARAQVDALAHRSGVIRATFVCSFVRPRPGMASVEEWSAYVCLDGELVGKGKGHSREEALFDALKNAGVDT